MNIKGEIKQLLQEEVKHLSSKPPEVMLTACRDIEHGDFTTNIAFLLARELQQPPQKIASQLVERLVSPACARIEAVAGYINFTLTSAFKCHNITTWLQEDIIGRNIQKHLDTRVLMEFVSSNPTGPLHIGHGRQAVVGDVLARIFRACHYQVDTEYYINDAGMQMDVLVSSVWIRMLQHCGIDIHVVHGLYQGEYLIPLAEEVLKTVNISVTSDDMILWIASLTQDQKEVYHRVRTDEEVSFLLLKSVIAWAKDSLGDNFAVMHHIVLDHMMRGIKDELAELGVIMQHYASEQHYVTSGVVDHVIENLNDKGLTYTSDGALWFSSKLFGDDKDRVLVRSNGERTYFTNDIAYHWDKVSRGYTRLINFLGSDHHGYVTRISAALQALGSKIPLDIRLVQFVSLIKKGQRISMSTRNATFEALHDVVSECGRDATRFFYIQRQIDQSIDFDVDLAVTQSQENPVYYVQYAHARLCRLLEKAPQGASPVGDYVFTSEDNALWDQLRHCDDVLIKCLEHLDPCYLAQYVYDLSKKIHTYYNNVPVLHAEETEQKWRIALLMVARKTLAALLEILGIAAPLSM